MVRRSLKPGPRALLAQWHIAEADGDIVLLTMPRLFGSVFNPVSFWFCLDATGDLRAVISDVTNTFHDRHCYLSFRDDHGVIDRDEWLRAEKVFHVSPFLEITGHYQFRFVYSTEKIGVWINHYTSDAADAPIITTSLTGRRQPATSRALLVAMLRAPFAVLALIHVQALRLFAKRIRYHRRPSLPPTKVSR